MNNSENNSLTGGKSFEGYTTVLPRNVFASGGAVVDCSVKYVGTSRSCKGFVDERGNHRVKVTSTDEQGNKVVTIEEDLEETPKEKIKDKKKKKSKNSG